MRGVNDKSRDWGAKGQSYLNTSYCHSLKLYTSILFVSDVQEAVSIPVLVGSGVTMENYSKYKSANALIVGSYFKQGHHWRNDIDETCLKNFMDMVRRDRS